MNSARRFIGQLVLILVIAAMTGACPLAAASQQYYKPIGEWTGRLILPKPEQREADGSVFIQVHNSPEPGLTGKILRLRWDRSRAEDLWFDELTTDVRFDPKKTAKAQKSGNIVPLRLDGWKRVSPLESLAGARPADDVTVMIKNAVYTDGSIYTNSEPVLICGSHVALVKFIGPANGNYRQVVHYNPDTKNFDGPAENIYILQACRLASRNKLISTTLDIEQTPFNGEGFYIYGTRVSNPKSDAGSDFIVLALMPRSLHALRPSSIVRGKSNIKHYYSKLHFKNLEPGTSRINLVVPEKNADVSTHAGLYDYIDSAWPEGTRGLLVHIFGWRKNIVTGSSDLSGPPGIYGGHFAFGTALVERDAFTGEKRFDIEYKQIYAHGDCGVISASMKWHAYMGDLKRGWMYTVPVSDTIIQIPAMAPYDIGGWKIDPLKGFARLTEIMMANYRIGGGSGVSCVTPYFSCVQDSHYALYGALMTFEKTIRSDPRVSAWLASLDKNHPEALRYEELSKLIESVKNRITIIGLSRHDWKTHFDNPLGTRDPDIAAKTIRTLLSLKTIFPRDAHDNLLFMGANRQYRMWSVMSVMCGGRAPELWPLPPNSLVNR